MFDPQMLSLMRGSSREHMGRIWQNGESGESLPLDEELMYKAMLDHPEYRDIWENASHLGDHETDVMGVNPFLHVALHCAIEHQLVQNTPPEVGQTLSRLMTRITNRHDAITMIMGVLVTMMQETTAQNKLFDPTVYAQRLTSLNVDR